MKFFKEIVVFVVAVVSVVVVVIMIGSHRIYEHSAAVLGEAHGASRATVQVHNPFSQDISRSCWRARWHDDTPTTLESEVVCVYDLRPHESREVAFSMAGCNEFYPKDGEECDPMHCGWRYPIKKQCVVEIEEVKP